MGTLKILLQRATNLDTVDIFDQRPFCIMEYGAQKVRSKPCTTNGKDPVWDTAYKFQVTDGRSMTFLIKDESSKKLLGTATLDLTIALKRGKDETTLPVYTTDKYQQGTISVKIRYSADIEVKDGKVSKKELRHSDNQVTPTLQAQTSKRGKRDQGKGGQPAADDDLDFMSAELESPAPTSTSSRPTSAEPSNPFLAPTSSWGSHKRASSTAEMPRQPSGDGAVVEDLIEMNKKLNQEMKSLKVAFEDQGQLLSARNTELEEMHAMLDRWVPAHVLHGCCLAALGVHWCRGASRVCQGRGVAAACVGCVPAPTAAVVLQTLPLAHERGTLCRYASEKADLEADLQQAHQSNGEKAAAADAYGLTAFKQLENEKADAHGQLVLAERERQQAEDDLQVRWRGLCCCVLHAPGCDKIGRASLHCFTVVTLASRRQCFLYQRLSTGSFVLGSAVARLCFISSDRGTHTAHTPAHVLRESILAAAGSQPSLYDQLGARWPYWVHRQQPPVQWQGQAMRLKADALSDWLGVVVCRTPSRDMSGCWKR
jgi:hypothetical protein